MILKKRANYREGLRREQKEQFKVNIRNEMILALGAAQQEQSREEEQFGCVGVSKDDPNLRSMELSSQEQKQIKEKVLRIIENFKKMIEGTTQSMRQQMKCVGYFNSLLRDFRSAIIYGADFMTDELTERVFLFIRTEIELAFEAVKKYQLDLQSMRLIEERAEHRHLLHLTMLVLISEYIKKGGRLQEQLRRSKWLVAVFYDWKVQFQRKLSDIVKMQRQADYKESSLALQIQIGQFKYYLKELLELVKVISHYQPDNFKQLILSLFSMQFTEDIVSFLQSYHTPDTFQALATLVLLEVSSLEIAQHFNVVHNLLKYCKFQLIIREQFKFVTLKTKPSVEQKCQLEIVSNILYILSYIGYICSSDIFWQTGICSELKCMVQEIMSQQIREDFIQFLLSSVTQLSCFEIVEELNRVDFMDWTVKVLDNRIHMFKEESLTSIQLDRITVLCLDVLRYFIEVGEEEKQSNSYLSLNPYLIKLKYLRGDVILCQFPLGEQFLDWITATSSF